VRRRLVSGSIGGARRTLCAFEELAHNGLASGAANSAEVALSLGAALGGLCAFKGEVLMQDGNYRNSEKGAALFLGTIALVMIIPMLGMFVDISILYVAKARLQSSVDGASLAAARALNLGQTPSEQQSSAQQNAINWFYANFPSGNWATSGTVMNSSTVVFSNASNVRSVQVTASTNVPTFFMKWFNVNWTTISAIGTASRRDVVIMMVMDRSGSMNSNNGCANMRSAAKIFTGQFAAGRDQLGMVEFGDTAWVDSSPTTNFQTVLGYTNNSGSGAGLIDSINCNDNTNTPQALSLGYNELYKMNLPGAFNILMFFTDGIPNSLTLNFQNIMLSTSGCRDSTGIAISSGGSFVTHPPAWTPGWAMAGGSYLTSIPAGPIGVVASDDPNGSGTYGVRHYQGFSQSSDNHGTISSGNAPGCAFSTPNEPAYVNDFRLLPPLDAYGNSLVENSYNSLTTDSHGNVILSSTADNGTPLSGNNLLFHYAARNAADEAAQQARSNATIPVTIFGVGLGGTSLAPPGYDFMQRIANDPNADLYNSPALYPACSTEAACEHWANQPQGTFIFSSSPTQLNGVFLTMASQILRLSH
jgi:Flp pilus assembly protein TadG